MVDLDDLLNCLRCDPVSGRRSRIRSYYYAALESERECGCAVSDLDGAVGI